MADTQAGRPDETPPLLAVDSVSKRFRQNDTLLGRLVGERQHIDAVSAVTLDVAPGETLGLVGESGSGKSTLANLIVGLHEPTSGEIRFDGDPIGHVTQRPMEVLADIGMVFQNPRSSLDSRLTVRAILHEPMHAHGWQETRRRERTSELLDIVDLAPRHADRYPHELSGGQAQRVAIARAIALDPRLVVLDEPTSALDASVQAKILNLLTTLQRDLGLAYLFISHDLSVVEHVADRVAVMYLGTLLEVAPTTHLFDDPRHPYTRALLSAIPSVNPSDAQGERIVLMGETPSLLDPPTGCRFHTRCPVARPHCRTTPPEFQTADAGKTRCHYPDG